MRRKKVSKMDPKKAEKLLQKSETHYVQCTLCGNDVKVDTETIAVKCSRCTTLMAPPDPRLLKSYEEIQAERKEKAKFPKGWKLMKTFVLEDGTVYEKGIENSELKGTLPPTDVAAIKAERKKKKKGLKEKINEKEQREQELAERHKEAKKERKKSQNGGPIVGTDIPSISTNKEIIYANVSLGENGFYEAIDDGNINYTALVNDQKKLKYVFNNSKKIMGKRNEDGSYSWRGCK